MPLDPLRLSSDDNWRWFSRVAAYFAAYALGGVGGAFIAGPIGAVAGSAAGAATGAYAFSRSWQTSAAEPSLPPHQYGYSNSYGPLPRNSYEGYSRQTRALARMERRQLIPMERHLIRMDASDTPNTRA